MVGVSGDSMSLLALIETTKAKYSEVEVANPGNCVRLSNEIEWAVPAEQVHLA